jgi:DNA repair protein RadC
LFTPTIREVGLRIIRETPYVGEQGASPEAIARLWTELMGKTDWFDRQLESITVLLLDTKLRVDGFYLAHKGGKASASIEPSIIMRPIILAGSPNFVLVHNHPSGDPTPSAEDVQATLFVKAAADLTDIKLVDHIVVGTGNHWPGEAPVYSIRNDISWAFRDDLWMRFRSTVQEQSRLGGK